jgi:hypothetical protein
MADTLHLSAAGAARRDAMRSQLIADVVRRRRRRRATRGVFALLLLLGAGLLAGRVLAPASGPEPVVRGPGAGRLEVIGNDRGVLARLSVGGPPAAVAFLDDDQLVSMLVQDGRPAGLVRSGGHVDVVPRVGEEWLAPP